MLVKETPKQEKGRLYLIKEKVFTITKLPFLVVGVLVAALSARASGQYDVYTKRLYIAKTLLLRLRSATLVR